MGHAGRQAKAKAKDRRNPASEDQEEVVGKLTAPWEVTEAVTTIAKARQLLTGTKALVPMRIGRSGTTYVQTVHETVYDMIREGYAAHMSYTEDLDYCVVVSFSARDDLEEHIAERHERYGYVS